jgi:peptidoglycan/LPS O-acetylase OafA/YrhL
MNTTQSQRRYDLDWLRVLAILTVFLYHSSRFFNLGDWHIKNFIIYPGVELILNFMELWMMPLIFVISGASLFYALGKGGAGMFFKDKVLRLLVPLAVGAFTHAALQVYLERITHGEFAGTFFQFLPLYFTQGVYVDVGEGGNFAFHGLHLWYLMILFIYAIAFYPLLRWLKDSSGKVLSRMGKVLAASGWLYLAALPTLVMEGLTGDTPLSDAGSGGWSFVMYISFLLTGFVLASSQGVQANIRRLRWVSLLIAVCTYPAFRLIEANSYIPLFDTLENIFGDPLVSLSAWSFILAAMGFSGQYLTENTRFLKYASPAVLPFYILHQTVLLVAGYFILQWNIPDLLKWLLIASISFAAIMGAYEYTVRRNNVMRFLFGMKALPAAPKPAAAESLSRSPAHGVE